MQRLALLQLIHGPHDALYSSQFNIEVSSKHRIFLFPQPFKKIFPNSNYFCHHEPLPESIDFADEGAANQMRFCNDYHEPGIHLFVYGRSAWESETLKPSKFPARQTFEASQALAKRHKIFPEQIVMAQQNPKAIDAGVFHNDVASLSNKNILIYHEEAFLNSSRLIAEIREKMKTVCGIPFKTIKVESNKVTLKEAVNSYLFNSQLISLNEKEMALIVPFECTQIRNVQKFIDDMAKDDQNPIQNVYALNLQESMQNGGGPACLRLRVVLTEEEINETHPSVFFTEERYEVLKAWIETHYRDRLSPHDLADPLLWNETKEALDKLTKILDLGSIYSFQFS